ncbi:MAG: hypothetical protein K2M59_09765, partial [Muribaculaceae bacterium]|nr:hypothetical protein [Muribaculaceae bacterium]
QKDDKVRPEHAALDGVTLPPSDPFWVEFYPPNGWNCRCTVVQVRKSKYPATPHEEAMRLGDEALQRDRKGIFRFNPGLEQSTVPAYNPYTIRRCRDCDIAKGKAKLARMTPPDNQVCEACHYLRDSTQSDQDRIESNHKEYKRLLSDSNYTDVEFNPDNGGLKAKHISHANHNKEKESRRFFEEKLSGTDLEEKCQDILFRSGYSCILTAENVYDPASKKFLRSLDCLLDGKYVDIKSITKAGKNTIPNGIKDKKEQLREFNEQHHCDASSLILYFHKRELFDESKIRKQLGHTFKEFICVFGDGSIIKIASQ